MKPSGPRLLSLMVAIAACGGANNANDDGNNTPYEDFSASGMSGAKWNQGQYKAQLTGGMAAMSQAIVGARANQTYNTNLVAVPPSGGDVTTFQSEIVVDSASATGTAFSRGNVDILYQPLANRLQGPSNTENLIIARVTLEQSVANAGLKARFLLLECNAGAIDCTQSTAIGTKSGTWPNPVAVTSGITYTVSIIVDRTAKTFTFAISGGTLGTLSETVNVSAVTTPWVPDLSASNFYLARLRAQVGGGATGGDGSIAARYDNVMVGVDGGAASLFDDFTAGTTFDSSKWAIGGENVQLVSGAVQMSLEQKDKPASLPLNLADTSTSALQADVTVTQHSATGSGRVAAQLRESLYNDGSNGSGTAPDTNGANSMVGDLLATISMTGTDVSYAVVRCETAQCATLSFVQPFTSLGTVTLGTTHTLYLNWDAAHHRAEFQLDGNAAVAFDPVAEGHAISSAPRVPNKRIALGADSAGTGQPFTTGSTGAITATFDNVKTN